VPDVLFVGELHLVDVTIGGSLHHSAGF
jgi:hypothetical protein